MGLGSAFVSLVPGLRDEQQNKRHKREAQKDRDFQEEMSSSAYQRGVVDMEKAGLNPALMYGGGASSASTPGGSTADVDKGTGGVVSSALQSKRIMAELVGIKATGRKEAAIADREEATNQAYGITYSPSGRLTVNPNKDMPTLVSMIHANVNSAKANAAASMYGLAGLRNISSVQSSLAGAPLTSAQQLMSSIMGRSLVTRASR